MADVFALDSNVYIDALRDRGQLDALKAFLARAGARVVLSAVVAMELRAGALTPDHDLAVRTLIDPYQRRGRVMQPTFEAYLQAGRVLAALRGRPRAQSAAFPPSLVSDALLASSCRENDVVLVTRNAGDFTRIQRHLRGFRFVTPWPLAASRQGRFK